jgi:hypothetical protein
VPWSIYWKPLLLTWKPGVSFPIFINLKVLDFRQFSVSKKLF